MRCRHIEAPDVRKLATSGGFTCILGEDGMVRCVVANSLGQLGDDTKAPRQTLALIATPVGGTFATIDDGGDSHV